MSKTYNPEINIDEIVEKIRREVAKRRESSSLPSFFYNQNASESTTSSHWSQISSSLNIAEQYADVGTKNLPMLEFPKWIRRTARLAGRIVLYFTLVITVPQRRFNRHILHILRTMLDGMRSLHQELIIARTDLIDEIEPRLNALESRVQQKTEQTDLEDILQQIRDHKLKILDQERRLHLLLDEARKRLPEPIAPKQIETILTEEDHFLNALYVSFEDRFRGAREEIKGRQKVYLSYINKAGAGGKETPILDIGCGRGEWLELCKENKLLAKGVDINRVMVAQCLECGLDAVEGDAVAFLRRQKPDSFGAVTGFHLVEHLPLRILISLFDEVLRVVKPGGIAIFETPNPENVLVGSHRFYLDPTHNNPIPPDTLVFLVEQRGFVSPEVIRLHSANEFQVPEHSELKHLISCFNGAQDSAVVAKKA